MNALLIGLQTGSDNEAYDASIAELAALAEACELKPVGSIVQRAPQSSQKTHFGSGKVTELAAEAASRDADIVLCNEALTPMQVRNLEDALDVEVLDRTGLILQIFSRRARTREAKLQVEAAQLRYLLPRLAGMHKELSRQGGGSGRLSNKGAGEEKIELDRRRIEHRITELDRQLARVETERATQRRRRRASGLPLVALVGYTNAGKSTLMNALLSRCGAEDSSEKQVFAKDMLFATLDTAVRRIEPDGMATFLLSDTVGFISDLPAALIKAFRSTLDEVRYADLILLVADMSDPDCDARIAVTARTLADMEVRDIPILRVYNKCDLTDGPLPPDRDDRVYISAGQGLRLDALLEHIEALLRGGYAECAFLVPYTDGGIIERLRSRCTILDTQYTEDGILVTLRCGRADEHYLAQRYTRAETAQS